MQKSTACALGAFLIVSAFAVAKADPRSAAPEASSSPDMEVTPFDGQCVDPLDPVGPEKSRTENWKYECQGSLPAPRCREDAGYVGSYETSIQSNGALLVKYECRKS